MTYQNFSFDIDADGIALVTWNMPGRSMNVIDAKVMEELTAIVEKVATDAAIKGAVLTSGKDAFCAGADLTMLETQSRAFAAMLKAQGEEAANKQLFEESRKLSQIASLGSRRLTAPPWAVASNWRSPAITASLPRTTRRGSVCRKSKSVFFPVAAAPSVSRA
jgi:3-hydroxyacyl-CoA dehydrogenase/enoyl-CoA hydratase/3-hydroxybutyryl-CoA epimerase